MLIINIFIGNNAIASSYDWDLNTSTEYILSDTFRLDAGVAVVSLKKYYFDSSDIVLDIGSSVDSIIKDLDNDGDLDIYVTNDSDGQNKLWINDGLGNAGASFTVNTFFFIDNSWGASFGDLDGDGDIDLYVANAGQQNKLWLNGYPTDHPNFTPNIHVTFTKK